MTTDPKPPAPTKKLTPRELAHVTYDVCNAQFGLDHSALCDRVTSAIADRDATHLERERVLREALSEARQCLGLIAGPNHPKPLRQEDWRGWMEVFDTVQRVAANGAHRAALAAVAPPGAL